MFFIIESRVVDTGPVLAQWVEYERHPAFWTARNALRVMLEANPKWAGKGLFRISRVEPLTQVY